MSSASRTSAAPCIPVSWGELIDKITILEIKNARLTNGTSLANVRRELKSLTAVAERELAARSDLAPLKLRLVAVNTALWDIENDIRGKEAAGVFDIEFVELARAVYKRNDERAAIKKQINALVGSDIVEEKSYEPY